MFTLRYPYNGSHLSTDLGWACWR